LDYSKSLQNDNKLSKNKKYYNQLADKEIKTTEEIVVENFGLKFLQ